MSQAEQNRLIANLIRTGTVAAVQPKPPRVRVNTGKLTTEWLPFCNVRAGKTKHWSCPSVGEGCVVLSPSGELAAGVVIVGFNTTGNPPPSDDPDVEMIEFSDSANISYNAKTGALLIEGIKTLQVKAGTSIEFDTPETTTTGKLSVKGLLTYFAGLLGLGASEGGDGAVMKGNITVDGNIHATGSVIDEGGNTPNHIHAGAPK